MGYEVFDRQINYSLGQLLRCFLNIKVSPLIPIMSSRIKYIINTQCGFPSKNIENILPAARPSINTTRQYKAGLRKLSRATPKNHIIACPI